MPRNRRLQEAHFICHQRRRVNDQNDGTFLTGEWVMKPKHIWQGLVFAVHETKAQPSYLQGVVLRVTNVRNDRKPSGRLLRRVELLVRRTPASHSVERTRLRREGLCIRKQHLPQRSLRSKFCTHANLDCFGPERIFT